MNASAVVGSPTSRGVSALADDRTRECNRGPVSPQEAREASPSLNHERVCGWAILAKADTTITVI